VIRGLYRGLIWLHPPSFQEQFGEEFLWIFDLRQASETCITLLFDCLFLFAGNGFSAPAFGSLALVSW
jgi:hypothetical protein